MHQLYRLINNSKLQILSVNYCKLGDPGGIAIGDALALSTNIREIRAKKNEFRD